jgi:hypothetical protein
MVNVSDTADGCHERNARLPYGGLWVVIRFLREVKTAGELTERQEHWARLPIVSIIPIVGEYQCLAPHFSHIP